MRIEKSQALGRDIRREAPQDLGVSTWDGVREAIREGNVGEALAGIDYACAEAKAMHDSSVSLVDDVLTQLAKSAGEDEVYQLFRRRYEPLIRQWLVATPGVEESMQRAVEFQRGHFGETSVEEEADRYVVTCAPCGSGGRLRRTKKNLGRAEQPHDWTWNKPDMPLYCTHCAVMWEILPTELTGHPIRITLPPEQDTDPCVHLYYKDPASIPQKYLDRVGNKRGQPAEAPLRFVPSAARKSGADGR